MKIALIGYGKMGHMIEEIALQRGHEIVCKIDVNNPEDIDSPEFCSADVAIEFTNPYCRLRQLFEGFRSQREGGEWLYWLDERPQGRRGETLC